MNKLDKDYLALLQDILDNGTKKETRNGDTISVFGRQIRHNMKDGFPLLTTKKMAWKTMVTELLWFLRGDTNIKFLVDNNCHIWDGDAYKNYIFNSEWFPISSVNGGFIGTKTDSDEIMTQDLFINKIKTDDEFAKKWGELGPIYGKQWRKWSLFPETEIYDYGINSNGSKYPISRYKRIDQIQNLINDLKTNPDSRRLMVNAWNVGELDQMVLPPCHYGFQVYTRELDETERVPLMDRKLGVTENLPPYYTEDEMIKHNIPKRAISLMWNQRSADTPLGLPFNIASYALLLEIIAKTVNMVPDELIGNLGDCHIYENQIQGVKEQLTREPFALPTLNINTEFWPYEDGSCGEGPLDAIAVFNAFKDENFCKCLLEEDIQLGNYQSHPSIKLPLSN